MPKTPDDFVCVLRVASRRPGLGALLRAHPRVRPDGWWKKGVPDRLGRVPATSGFNVFLGQGGEWKEVAALLRRRIRTLSPMIRAGRMIGAEFELDVGVMLGGSRYVTRSARFGLRDLPPLADLGVELCVTAYPVSEPARARTKRRRKVAAPKP